MKLNFVKKQELRKRIANALYKKEPTGTRYLPKETLMTLIDLSENDPENLCYDDKLILGKFFYSLIEHIDLSEIKWDELSASSQKQLKRALESCTCDRKDYKKDKVERIKLPAELLNDMLFLSLPEMENSPKIPYFGKVKLSEIDLSELDFSNIEWDVVHCVISNGTKRKDGYYEIPNFPLIFKESSTYLIDMSYTNANIIFGRQVIIKNVNFEGTDLSNNPKFFGKKVENCNFRKTGIKLAIIKSDKYINCDFRDNDLNHQVGWISLRTLDNVFEDCQFQGTGLNIEFNNDETKEAFETLAEYIKSGCLAGCVVNGKLIRGQEESEEYKKELRKQYKEYAKTYEDLVFELINNPRTRKKEGE